jgi:glycerophosphoryl diester phosphodiesterase
MSERRRVEVIGHGGAGGFFPGNSRPSIEKALELGVDRIEFDVQLDGDGQLVLVHDGVLRDAAGRKRPVRQMATAEIRETLSGLLTFDEAVEVIDGRVPLLIDVKDPGYEPRVIEAIRRHNLDSTAIVSSTDARTIRRVRAAFPAMRLGLSTGHMAGHNLVKGAQLAVTHGLRYATPLLLLRAVRWCGATETMIQHRVCTARLTRLFHARNLRVNVWTVDQPAAIRRVLALDVDAVISNRPDLVLELAADRAASPRGKANAPD